MTVKEYNRDFLPRIQRAREFVSLLKVRLTTWMTRGLIKKKYENNFEYGVGLKKRSRLF